MATVLDSTIGRIRDINRQDESGAAWLVLNCEWVFRELSEVGDWVRLQTEERALSAAGRSRGEDRGPEEAQ